MTLICNSVKMMQIENTTIFHHLRNHKYNPLMKKSTEKVSQTILKTLEAKTETIKHQMRSTLNANGQTDSSTDDDRSSTDSYKGKCLKNSKPSSYCSACGEPDHNTGKCKIKNTLFCDFCNKKGHVAKACKH